jgi:hypothetical protein
MAQTKAKGSASEVHGHRRPGIHTSQVMPLTNNPQKQQQRKTQATWSHRHMGCTKCPETAVLLYYRGDEEPNINTHQ